MKTSWHVSNPVVYILASQNFAMFGTYVAKLYVTKFYEISVQIMLFEYILWHFRNVAQ